MAVTEIQRKQAANRLPSKRPLKGAEKAAILFLCLGEQRGSALMQKLTNEEIQTMTRAMSGLGVIEAEQVDAVMSDFVEGIANGDQLHPLQQTFLEGAALQCGVCTPGFLVAAKALLDENPDPTETEIRYGLAGNLCRCTGYDKIIRAVQDAAEQLRASA